MPKEVRVFGHTNDSSKVPELSLVQAETWNEFLQKDVPAAERTCSGLEALLRESFPVGSFDGAITLNYISYDLKRPRHSIEECRALRLTYGYPLRVRLRLDAEIPIEEDVYLGDVPVMIGGGEFLINGTERVVVNQLHRSPGVDFMEEIGLNGKKTYISRLIPDRGSWVEILVSRKDIMQVMIDQSGKFTATTLLRAFSPKFGTDAQIISYFWNVGEVDLARGVKGAEGKVLAEDCVKNEEGELVRAGSILDEETAIAIRTNGKKSIKVVLDDVDVALLHSLQEDGNQVDPINSHEEALMHIYTRLRPGNPKNLDKAKEFFRQKFIDETRYQLGPVGRFRLNRKLGIKSQEKGMILTADDFAHAIKYLMGLRAGSEGYSVDDIDNLGNRRVRQLSDLACEEFRKGFVKLKRSTQERMSMMSNEDKNVSPRTLISSKTISSTIDYFFSRSELSQVVDQTNPLTLLSHERRLSALGPGGLNRKRAGFEVRDVHISHYGRICPIETPEGANIGLITNMSIYARLDKHGFLTCPYREVEKGRMTGRVVYLRADEEENKNIAPADTQIDANGKINSDKVQVRRNQDFTFVMPADVHYVDVSPKQMLGVPASLIPFLEHDDANRALMGSNMQRQAVPLLVAEAPLVGTGMEKHVASSSSMVIKARNKGTVTYVDAARICVGDDVYELRKFAGLNEKTCQNQRPVVRLGQKIRKGQVIADGAAIDNGELALGRNVLVAFMTWDGFNFEDAIIISNRLVKDDVYTSLHINELDVEIRETKLGKEEFTRDIPNVSESALRNLDEFGVVRVGAPVKEGDYLVGKVSPKSKAELSPEEKLLYAIFGKAGEDVKDDSLKAPAGMKGVVVKTERFTRKSSITEDERKRNERKAKKIDSDHLQLISELTEKMLAELKDISGKDVKLKSGLVVKGKKDFTPEKWLEIFTSMEWHNIELPEKNLEEFKEAHQTHYERIDEIDARRIREVSQLRRGHELPTGVLEMVKVYVSTKRVLSVGDKMAGRHGNKGVISRVVPEEDMPYLPDGRPVDIILNPLGVPSRMNVGQILETHLGWAARILDFKAEVPVFSKTSITEIDKVMREAMKTTEGSESGIDASGRVKLYDGRTGQMFKQPTTVGYIYMLKLNHLIDDKVHARATGPYSLITQQPLGGKARYGGQRYGEMEVWALEAYGAASILQEMMTVKSDDVEGRTRIYESMVKGKNILVPGTPVTYNVLTNEIRGLALNMKLHKPDLPDVGDPAPAPVQQPITGEIMMEIGDESDDAEEDNPAVAMGSSEDAEGDMS